jgi:arylsulfatase A-like enzyme
MRKLVLSLAAMALALLLALGVAGSIPKVAGAPTAKPNIVFILTDDMRKDDLRYMPKTKTLLQERGMSFENAFVSNPICCPSRATTMTGQYSHNTGVWNNGDAGMGGLYRYRMNGYEQDNMATRLDAAGYRTALFGKYLNGYKGTLPDGARYVPPGWDRWFATVDPTTYNFYNYDISDNGTITHFGTSQSDYKTDVLKRKTKTFINNSASLGTPFFAYVAPIAPHGPATPAPRDAHDYDGVSAPRLPSFNERRVFDKPSWIRNLPRLSDATKADIDNRHENRAESLQAVDDLVAEVVGKLRDKGVLSNTYIFFTSDNGWHQGEHRIPAHKYRPYEEDIHVPLLVRAPDVAAGSTTYKLTLNTDYLPTFISLAGAQTPSYPIDGRSLKPILDENATPWRNAILIEGPQRDSVSPAYSGIRTVGTYKRKYVEYEGTTAREMYYLGGDPYELTNKPQNPPAGLVSRLQELKNCSGDSCRAAEEGQ